MKSIVRILLIVLLIVGAGVLVLSLLAPSEFNVKESKEYKGVKPAFIHNYVANFKQFARWEPWMSKADDSVAQQTFHVVKGGSVGDSMKWVSEDQNIGTGYQVIRSMSDDSIGISLIFTDPWQADSDVWFTIEETEEGSKLEWGYKEEPAFPNNVFMWIMGIEGMLSEQYQTGLNSLDSVMQVDMEKFSGIQPQVVTVDDKVYWGVKSTVGMAETQRLMEVTLPVVYKSITSANLTPESHASAIYWEWDEEMGVTEMAPAWPISEGKALPPSGVESWSVGGKMVEVTMYGSYDKFMKYHTTLSEYMDTQNYEVGIVIEDYLVGPDAGVDPSEYITRIRYQIL